MPPRRFAAAAVAAAIALPGCANYSGIHSDKHMAPPANFEAAQSLPAEGGQWPSLNWASQFGVSSASVRCFFSPMGEQKTPIFAGHALPSFISLPSHALATDLPTQRKLGGCETPQMRP